MARNMSKDVNEYLGRLDNWQDELSTLRHIVLGCGVEETVKWGVPVYMAHNGNIALLGSFKDHCVLSFIKGVLLNDPEKVLESPGENSQSVRLFRFRSVKEIEEKEGLIKAFIFEAMEVEKAGIKVAKQNNEDIVFVEELQKKLVSDPLFSDAFFALTPGRRRAYNIYFSSAKQSKSRDARIEKYTPRILNGKGINDCVCGHSKRMPNCDGSHKLYE